VVHPDGTIPYNCFSRSGGHPTATKEGIPVAVRYDPEQMPCPACGSVHLVQRHDLMHHDRGALACPRCAAAVVTWDGSYFYTLAVDPPKSPSAGEIDVVDPH
jgi:endogenous inhibitor of DNA gyrase (YacG/DUF329 family)